MRALLPICQVVAREWEREREEQLLLTATDWVDTHDFVEGCGDKNVVLRVAQNITESRGSAIDARTTRHPG